MKRQPASRKRRQFLVAGLAGCAAPALAGSLTVTEVSATPGAVVLSGRVVDGADAPIRDAVVTLGTASAMTDADGRFVLDAAVKDVDAVEFRIEHAAHGARLQRVPLVQRLRAQRDEAGVLRPTVGLRLA